FQSRLGPTRWLGPDTKERLAELAEMGEKRVLVCPISFTVDCLETLEEIGLRYREILAAKGGQLYLCPCLNTYKPFIAALKNLVLHGSQPMTSWGCGTGFPAGQVTGWKACPTLLSSASVDESEMETTDADLKSLVMIGASLPNRVGTGRGPRLHYSDPDELCCVKKSHEEVHAFLEKIRAEGSVREAFVWNTCHRFEFYGWLKNPEDVPDRECVIGRTWHQLFPEVPDALRVNVLFESQAWHHLMRTVAGLNSGLPGDRDVTAQLQTAQRLADHAGTGGPRSRRLVERAVAMERELRNETAWGRYDPGYCLAAFSRIRKATGLKPAECRYTAIGGSTTSRSVLEMLSDAFDVPKRQMTIVYRGHKGGQMKLLRAAIGNGKRVRVQSYGEPAVIRAIAQSDVVFFGTDRDEPVLDAQSLRQARDFTQRPLIIIDFNTFGSTSGVETIEGVTVWKADRLEQEVGAYADAMCAQEDFIHAAREADAWIESRMPELSTPYFEPPCKRAGGASPPVCRHCQQSNADEVGWPMSFGHGADDDTRSDRIGDATRPRSSPPPPPKEVGHPSRAL
ncbi:MAG: ferrochelatase, partial [Phycisphaerae bacterium]